ncbi:MAG: YbaK/EbsC family protein [Verrucomicrobia bacterium]|nr:YbaK/EbsC family protein [Verrucomicrobiota bacterium]
MTALEHIEQYLKQQKVRYEVIHHARAFTSQQVAQAEHVPGKMQAKVVVLTGDGSFYMAVLPASYHVAVEEFGKVVGRTCRLATEAEFKNLFPDCEVGAMPPFGQFYNLPVYADASLEEDDEIVFQAGTHTESVKIAWNDFVKLQRPIMAHFGKSPKPAKLA